MHHLVSAISFPIHFVNLILTTVLLSSNVHLSTHVSSPSLLSPDSPFVTPSLFHSKLKCTVSTNESSADDRPACYSSRRQIRQNYSCLAQDCEYWFYWHSSFYFKYLTKTVLAYPILCLCHHYVREALSFPLVRVCVRPESLWTPYFLHYLENFTIIIYNSLNWLDYKVKR